MEFRILGSLEAESSGTHVPLGGRRDQCVLAALLLDAGRVVPMPRLVDAAWDDPPATASKQAMNAVSRLRRVPGGAGGGDLIVTVAGGYRLAADGCTVDAQVFEAGVAAAGQAASEGKIAEAAGSLHPGQVSQRLPDYLHGPGAHGGRDLVDRSPGDAGEHRGKCTTPSGRRP